MQHSFLADHTKTKFFHLKGLWYSRYPGCPHLDNSSHCTHPTFHFHCNFGLDSHNGNFLGLAYAGQFWGHFGQWLSGFSPNACQSPPRIFDCQRAPQVPIEYHWPCMKWHLVMISQRLWPTINLVWSRISVPVFSKESWHMGFYSLAVGSEIRFQAWFKKNNNYSSEIRRWHVRVRAHLILSEDRGDLGWLWNLI